MLPEPSISRSSTRRIKSFEDCKKATDLERYLLDLLKDTSKVKALTAEDLKAIDAKISSIMEEAEQEDEVKSLERLSEKFHGIYLRFESRLSKAGKGDVLKAIHGIRSRFIGWLHQRRKHIHIPGSEPMELDDLLEDLRRNIYLADSEIQRWRITILWYTHPDRRDNLKPDQIEKLIEALGIIDKQHFPTRVTWNTALTCVRVLQTFIKRVDEESEVEEEEPIGITDLA